MPQKKGLIIINTGNGKGKTTAALGVALRAVGQDLKVTMVQFIKGGWRTGEYRAAPRLAPNFEIIRTGLGFTRLSKDIERDKAQAQNGWKLAKKKIESGLYDIVILDELTHAINLGFVDLEDVLQTFGKKAEALHIIITGTDAPQKMIDIADLVTEMKLVKHPYNERVPAQRGIEF